MPIRVSCENCGKELRVKSEFGGKKIKCPGCKEVVQIPADDDDDVYVAELADDQDELPRRGKSNRGKSSRDDGDDTLARKKKKSGKGSKERQSESGIPVWVMAAGGAVALIAIGGIGFVVMSGSKPQATNPAVATGQPNSAPAAAAARPAAAKNIVECTTPLAKFKVKWEMPPKWTQESSIEEGIWPWAKMTGQGQTIRMTTMRSISGTASTMTTMGGRLERLKAAHGFRLEKLQAENTDYTEGPLNIHEGKYSAVVWTDYEYKGVFSKAYGTRCTIVGQSFRFN